VPKQPPAIHQKGQARGLPLQGWGILLVRSNQSRHMNTFAAEVENGEKGFKMFQYVSSKML